MSEPIDKRILVEIVCCSADDCAAAEAGGADRIELCAAIELGGLTPSAGMLRAAREACRLPLMAMIRPRSGGFAYSATDFASMEHDAELAVAGGAGGIVFGVLTSDGEIDMQRCAALTRRAAGFQNVFHRAFDVLARPLEALERLIDLGFSRVLTSGQRATAMEGAELIARLIDHARGRIEVLPGGGIRAANAGELLRRTGARQVHLAPFATRRDSSTAGNRAIRYAGALTLDEREYYRTDESAVRSVVTEVAPRRSAHGGSP